MPKPHDSRLMRNGFGVILTRPGKISAGRLPWEPTNQKQIENGRRFEQTMLLEWKHSKQIFKKPTRPARRKVIVRARYLSGICVLDASNWGCSTSTWQNLNKTLTRGPTTRPRLYRLTGCTWSTISNLTIIMIEATAISYILIRRLTWTETNLNWHEQHKPEERGVRMAAISHASTSRSRLITTMCRQHAKAGPGWLLSQTGLRFSTNISKSNDTEALRLQSHIRQRMKIDD